MNPNREKISIPIQFDFYLDQTCLNFNMKYFCTEHEAFFFFVDFFLLTIFGADRVLHMIFGADRVLHMTFCCSFLLFHFVE